MLRRFFLPGSGLQVTAPSSSLRKQGPTTTGLGCYEGNSRCIPNEGPRSMGPCFCRDDAECRTFMHNELLRIQISNNPPCAGTASRSRGAFRPSFALHVPPSPNRGRRECRAPDAPDSRACDGRTQNAHALVRSHRKSPGIPRAMVLTVSFALSLATGLSCHHRPRSLART